MTIPFIITVVMSSPLSWCSVTWPCLSPGDSLHCRPPRFSAVGLSRQEYWSELPFPPPGDLPNQGSSPHLLRLLHCRRILCSLSRPGSPNHIVMTIIIALSHIAQALTPGEVETASPSTDQAQPQAAQPPGCVEGLRLLLYFLSLLLLFSC